MSASHAASLLLIAGLSGTLAHSAELRLQLRDAHGQPVPEVVAYVASAAAKPVGVLVDIDQIDKEFVPYVTVVPAGSRIRFPNKDNIRHHVYSFSETKKFELKLYSGVPAEPVQFDKAGVVALGCNIHDWMLAYVLVVDTPWYDKSNRNGDIALQLPPGPHQLQLWHPDLQAPTEAIAITVTDAAVPMQQIVTLAARASVSKQY